jgi:putative intracellular protease/amidase
MKILMVLTSHDKLGNTGRKTGFWLEEFAAPYFTFKDAGVEIVIASPKGGRPPPDPKSNEPNFQTDLTHRFEADADAQAGLATTLRLDSLKARTSTPSSTPVATAPCGIWQRIRTRSS